jgi:hypothetical protein
MVNNENTSAPETLEGKLENVPSGYGVHPSSTPVVTSSTPDNKTIKAEQPPRIINIRPQTVYETMNEEQLMDEFRTRYQSDERFRDSVYRDLKIGRARKAKLKFKSWILPSSYKKEVESIVHEYVVKLKKALDLQIQIRLFEEEKRKLAEKARTITEKEQVIAETEGAYNELTAKINGETEKINGEFLQQSEEERTALEKQKEFIAQKTNAESIVAEQLKKAILSSELVKKDDKGNANFDNDAMTRKIASICLDEILSGMAATGKGGFMGEIQNSYRGVFSHYEKPRSSMDIRKVDWKKSKIASMKKGFKEPTWPYLVVKRYKGLAKCSIDTAIMMDKSGSMREERWDPAKKTTLAIDALMRRLNPKNNTFLGVFSGDAYSVTPLELMNKVTTDGGGTYINKALDWIIDTLKDKGPSIGYLITDGDPQGEGDIVGETYKSAEKFRHHPDILLRIFAIDADRNMRKTLGEIARRTGGNTAIIYVDKGKIGAKVVEETNNAMKRMRGYVK